VTLRVLTALVLLAPSVALGAPKRSAPPPVAPAAPAAPPVDPEAWRASPPGPGAARAWSAPRPETFTLSNGIPVVFVRNEGLPLVEVQLLLAAGRESNPAGRAGLASLTASLLVEGTTTRTGAEIAATASGLGASLSSGSGDEMSWVSLSALSRNFDASLDLMADSVLRPRFAQEDVRRVQKQVLASIQASRAQPRTVARLAFARELFGANHPYGLPSVGTDATVGALVPRHVKGYHRAWWHAGNATFVVAGNVTREALQAALESRFGGWRRGRTTRQEVVVPAAPTGPRVVFVEQPGAVQSVLRIGTLGPARVDAAWMPANVAGTLVAGMFSSRVNMNLREEHGWSYGAFGGFTENRDVGTFAVGAEVQADQTAPAVREVLKELSVAAGRAPTPDELVLTRDYLLKSLPGNFETNGGTVGSYQAMPQFGLGADLWDRYTAETTAVDAPAAQVAAARWFDAARLVIVVVGPRTVEVDDGTGGKRAVDVIGELKALGMPFAEG
jgi:zinc protease